MKFSYTSYTNFLHAAQRTEILPLCHMLSAKNALYLRHDVDYSVEKAFSMFLLEKELGIKSSYLFMISGPYNILNKEYTEYLQAITKADFDVGLHFDPSIYDHDIMQEKLYCERNILEQCIQKEVRTVSLHRPATHKTYPIFNGFVNAYDKITFPDNYYSDSAMDFRGKKILDAIEDSRTRPVQVLLHPENYTEHGHDIRDVTKDLIHIRLESLHAILLENRAYRETCPEYISEILKDIQ